MRTAAPYYFLNVPALLERMRKAVDEQLWKTGGIVRGIYGRAKAAWVRKQESKARLWDGVLESPARNGRGAARWLVPYRRSGGNKRGRELADCGTDQEPDYPCLGPQYRTRAD